MSKSKCQSADALRAVIEQVLDSYLRPIIIGSNPLFDIWILIFGIPWFCLRKPKAITHCSKFHTVALATLRLPLAFSKKMDRVTILSVHNRFEGIADMTSIKVFSRRSLVFMLILGLAALGAAAAGFHFCFQWISRDTAALATPEMTPVDLTARTMELQHLYFAYMAAATALLLVLCGLVAWIGLRGIAKRSFAQAVQIESVKKKAAAGSTEERESHKIHQQRLFLHLLAVLQRQGRLVDFLFEDLDAYEDAQIGAAVRGIHENCRKVITKNLSLKAVIDAAEGEEVTVEEGFDPAAVKLTGNVTGRPPFKGYLRHRGWRTEKIEMPVLSDSQDASVIAPAEVDIP